MTTTDTDALKQRIARALYSTDFPTHMGGWDHARALAKERYADRAAAVLPIVAVEVRKAKAEALREAAREEFQFSPNVHYQGIRVHERLVKRAYHIETGDSDEHR